MILACATIPRKTVCACCRQPCFCYTSWCTWRSMYACFSESSCVLCRRLLQSVRTCHARMSFHRHPPTSPFHYPLSHNGANLLLIQILVAMLCVFGTGWPFVGVIFIPMLLNCAWLRLRRGTSFAEGLGAATASATWAVICAAAVGGLATWVDSGWYGRTTSPTFNIL